MRRTPLLLLVCTALSCYRVETPSGKYLCDRPGDVCPPGLECVGGRCRAPGEAATDLAGTPDGDGARPACPGGSTAVGRDAASGRDVLACTGAFASGQLGGACPTGYRACIADDAMLLAKVAMAAICDGVGGFYAAQIEASFKKGDEVMCPLTMAGQTRALVGCGREVRADNEAQAGTVAVRNECLMLKSALPCDGTVKGWSCTAGQADAANGNQGRGGVLCCKRP